MCTDCGCATGAGEHHGVEAPSPRVVEVTRQLLARNDEAARHNRAHFDDHGVLAVNLMSSPGSGKTLLLEATLQALRGEMRCAVIEGDLETDNDAARIRRHGVPAVQITTGSACHLDARMLHRALHELTLDALDIVFVENVGNLVCPASFALGTHRDIALLSCAEGDDKPAKYPVMFRGADLVLLTKTDLLPVFDDFEVARAQGYVRALANPAPVLQVSAKTGAGLAGWLEWLRAARSGQLQRTSRRALSPLISRHAHP